MTRDPEVRYAVCRGCGCSVSGRSAVWDGLCDAPERVDSCYEKVSRWYFDRGVELRAILVEPEDLVRIDAWLEAGAP